MQEQKSITLTRLEQETIIVYNAAEPNVEVYTADPVMMRRMDKLCEKRPEVFRIIKSDLISKTYMCPKKCIRVKAPRQMTEEQKQAAGERLARVRRRPKV